MDVRRTAVVKLAVSDEQRDALHRTADQYLYCANRTSEHCWSDTSDTECKTDKRRVRDALYAELRDETELQAQLVQAAIDARPFGVSIDGRVGDVARRSKRAFHRPSTVATGHALGR